MISDPQHFTQPSRNGACLLEEPMIPERPMLRSHRAVSPSSTKRKPQFGRLIRWVMIFLVIGLIVGLAPRLRKRAAVAAQTRDLSVPTVILVSPSPAKAPPPLLLNGELKALTEAPIHARATGYVRKWHVDIGSKVEPGQLMAELEIPEIDQQLSQARADLKHTEASRDLADTTAKRWAQMLHGKTVSYQEADEKQADANVAATAVESAHANVQRLEEMVSFAKIVAPFSGTVTARSVDIGQLVNAGSGQELFRVAQTDKLRLFVRVPQNYARSVTNNQSAELLLPEMPGRKFTANVVRTAGAIDAASRTLLTELEVDNSKGELFSGSYAQVRLTDATADASMTLPSNTLLFRPDGPVVAVLNATHVNLKHVSLGRDFGAAIEILDGIKQADRVVINPPDSLVEGVEVRVNESANGS